MHLVHQIASSLALPASVTAVGTGLFMAMEVAFPRSSPAIRTRVRGIVFAATWIIATAIIGSLYRLLWSRIGVPPLFSARLHIASAPLRLFSAVAIAVTVNDFCFYWRHRAQHAFFWRFHAVHHSVEDLNVCSTYHHPSEELFHIALSILPLSLLLDVPQTILSAVIVTLQGLYLHSCTAAHFPRPFKKLFCDNHYHRIHHSRDPAHFNRNFGAFFPIWDVLFGTAHFPHAAEWPVTGLNDAPEPRSLAEFVLRPFSGRRKLPDLDFRAHGERTRDAG